MSNLTLRQKLLAVQKEIGAIKKNKKNPFFSSNYFDINGLLEMVKPVLNKYNLVLLQPLITDNGKAAVKTILMDADSNESLIEYYVPLPETPDAQKMGSAVTYIRRYSLQSLLALEAEDDDGNSASGNFKKAAANKYPTMSAKPRTAQPRASKPYSTGYTEGVKKQLRYKHAPSCRGHMEQMPDGEWICSNPDCKGV